MKKFTNKIVRSFKRTILRDEFLLAHRKWRKIKGNQTLRHAYDLNESSIVLDIGGFEGDFAHDIHEHFGCRVHVFEPSADYAAACEERFKSNDAISVHRYGLSDKNETVLLSDDGDGSSVFRDADTKGQTVKLRSIRDVLEELHIERIDLLKANIEGGEYPLLQSMIDKDLIKRVRFFQIQFHDFVPNAKHMRTEIRDALAKTHKEQWCFPFVWESWEEK